MKRVAFADILKDIDQGRDKKIARKLPDWVGLEMKFPSTLSLEQCSSTETAQFKQQLLRRYCSVDRPVVCDLTGGMGVDTVAFSRVSRVVHYFERQQVLCDAAGGNFEKLGVDNVIIHCEEVNTNSNIPEADMIFLDPARRDGCGKKVFLLEDCTPDLLTLLPMLLEKTPLIMVKLSPMADITMLCNRLSPYLKVLYVVASDNEVKELLCILKGDLQEVEPDIVIVRLLEGEPFFFKRSEERDAEIKLAPPYAGAYLYEPRPEVLKAGIFKLLCERFNIGKIDNSTHLYISDEKIDSTLFKRFEIVEVVPWGREGFRYVKDRYPRGEVTAKNISLKSDELRKRLGVCSGGECHIFGCREYKKEIIIITNRV